MPVELVIASGVGCGARVSLASRSLDAGEDIDDDESIVTVHVAVVRAAVVRVAVVRAAVVRVAVVRVAVVRVAVVHVATLRSLVADVDSSMSHTMPIDPVSGISIELQPSQSKSVMRADSRTGRPR